MDRAFILVVDGEFYGAHIEFDEGGPFDHLPAPGEADGVDRAIAWARRRAPEVQVRIDEDVYSAGEIPIADLPQWPGPPPEHQAAHPEPSRWLVRGSFVWLDEGGDALAEALRATVEADPAVANVESRYGERRVAIAFAIGAESRDEAAAALRAAWAQLDRASEGYDLSNVDVRPA